jgi:[ribosomal protein S18]-alanine N-acetyltransferase
VILIPSISLAVPAHCSGIAEMSRQYIEYGLGWSWTASRVLKAIQDDSTNVAVIHGGGAIVGFGIMRYGEQKAHLILLCVGPAHRGRGYGAMLLSWLEKCAVTAGLEQVQLEARADNLAAIGFYSELGYHQTGTVPGYYCGVIDAVRLAKRLASGPDEVRA